MISTLNTQKMYALFSLNRLKNVVLRTFNHISQYRAFEKPLVWLVVYLNQIYLMEEIICQVFSYSKWCTFSSLKKTKKKKTYTHSKMQKNIRNLNGFYDHLNVIGCWIGIFHHWARTSTHLFRPSYKVNIL